MQRDVRTFIASCDVCQKCKPSNHSPYGLLQPIPPPTELWADLSMDFITHLPSSQGATAILVVLDHFSKAAHFAPLPTHYTASKIASVFWDSVGKIHGMPRYVILDRDPIFRSAFWQELMKLQGTTLRFTSAYHPESDGQTERANRCLQQYLRSFVHEEPHRWSRLLSWAEYHFNTTWNESIGMTPFEAMFGRRPPSMVEYCASAFAIEAVDNNLRSRDEILAALREALQRAQHRQKTQADKKRTDIEFSVGDQVLLKLQPYRQVTLRPRSSRKLSLRFYGPFRVLERIGAVAYRLALPASSRIHPVFHCSLLKPYRAGSQPKIHELPVESEASHPVLKPLVFLAERMLLRQGVPVRQLLVQWEGLPPDDATWEDADAVQSGAEPAAVEPPVVEAIIEPLAAPDAVPDAVQHEDMSLPDGGRDVTVDTVTNTVTQRPKRIRNRPRYLADYV